MNKIILIPFLLFLQHCTLTAHSTFIVPKETDKKLDSYSANSLKELLGESLRDFFKKTIELNKQVGLYHLSLKEKKDAAPLHASLGSFQVIIADVQEQASLALEKLLENQKPFKKATKAQLRDAYKNVQQGFSLMNDCISVVKREITNDEKAQKKITVLVTSIDKNIDLAKNFQRTLQEDPCLRSA